VQTGSHFDINNLVDQVKFFPNSGKNSQDFGVNTKWVPKINQSSRNMVNRKMSCASDAKIFDL
jgi:hypothetical protein